MDLWRYADAAEIEARAKRRLADEYDAAQARGEVKANGGARNFSVPNKNSEVPSAADIGLSRKDVFNARAIRDAENEHSRAPVPTIFLGGDHRNMEKAK